MTNDDSFSQLRNTTSDCWIDCFLRCANDEFEIKNDELGIKNDEYLYQKSGLSWQCRWETFWRAILC